MAKRTFSTLLGCMVAIGLVVGASPAGAARKESPPDPTADAERYGRWHSAARWSFVAGANYAAAVEFVRAAEYAAALENAQRVVTNPPAPAKTRQTATQGVSRPSSPNPAPAASGGSHWDQVAQCESGGNWSTSTGNGFSGGLQFSPSTWSAYGGSGSAAGASREEQIAVAERVLAAQGPSAWPNCYR